MATSKKLTVINTKPTLNPVYTYWGNQAQVAQDQNWLPVESGNGFTRYKQNYNAPFNDVVIPNSNEKGSIQVIGKNGNKMDIVIADKQGNIKHFINRDVTPEYVQQYFSRPDNTIAQRVNRINDNVIALNK